MENQNSSNNFSILRAVLLVARIIAGGALVVAAFGKIQNPKLLMLSMKSFDLVPEAIIPISSYILPWTELIVGALLIVGFAARGAAVWSTLLYSIFTVAIITVIARGMEVDCGCFGALLGGGNVGVQSIIRNLILLSSSVAVLWQGPGLFSIDDWAQKSNSFAGARSEPVDSSESSHSDAEQKA